MTHTAVRRGTLAALLLLLVACGDPTPTAPTTTGQPPGVPTTPAPPRQNFPPQSGPSRIFTFDREATYPVNGYTKDSRFVLYDNGAFALEYASLGLNYRGGYTESNGIITFHWEGWSAAGPWGATGVLKDESLTVNFNTIMQLTDFDDAVYRLAR